MLALIVVALSVFGLFTYFMMMAITHGLVGWRRPDMRGDDERWIASLFWPITYTVLVAYFLFKTLGKVLNAKRWISAIYTWFLGISDYISNTSERRNRLESLEQPRHKKTYEDFPTANVVKR